MSSIGSVRVMRRGYFYLLAIGAALLALLGVSAGTASAAITSIPANYLTVIDQGGANDVNAAQVDLTRFGRDDSDPNTYKLLWSWDATTVWTGSGQTGDACALFDSNGNGNVDFAVCANINNPGGNSATVQQLPTSPYLFSCGDDKNDRCTQPVLPLAYNALNLSSGALQADGSILPSPPGDLKTATDPFPNLLPDQNWPDDSTIAVNISKTLLPAGAKLLNVCTYPSAGAGGNNNPFDCIINPGDGLLKIVKVAPAGTTQTFSFTANPGSKPFQIVGSGSTAPFGMPSTSPASVEETVPASWQLDTAVCKLEDGTTVTGTKSGSTVSGILIKPGQVTTCTFTNSPKPPDLTLVKDNDGNHDGVFHDTELVSSSATYPYTVTYKATIGNAATSSDSTITSITDDKVSGDLRTAQAGLTDCADLIGTTLAAGATATCYFDATFASPPGPSVTNTVTVIATNNAGTSTKTDTSTVTFPGHVVITKTADTGPFSAGDTIGYTISVTNSGAGVANGVTVTDTLPTTAGTSWSIDAANSSSGCSIATGTLTCNFGTMAPGATKSVHITSPTTKDSCGTISNTGNVSSTESGSGSSTASLTVNCGQIGITKTADATTVNAGDQIGFVVTATNSGAGEARGVTVTDTLPVKAGVSWSIDAANSDTGCSISSGVLTCNWGTLASGASKHVHLISQTTKDSCGLISNTANVTTTNDGSGQASASVTVNCGNIGITKTADAATVSAGDTIGFVITATNAGPGTTTTTTVTDTLPTASGISWSIDAAHSDTGCSIANGTSLTCNWGTLAASASKHVHLTSSTTKDSCGTLNNTAFVTTGNDGSGQASASITVNCGNITITKVADQGTVNAGDQIGFLVTAKNTGLGEARGVTVTDTLPVVAGVTWSIDQANSAAGCSLSGGVVTCNWGTLITNASKAVHIVGTTTKDSCGLINNTANVSTTNDGSGQASDSVTVNCGSISLTKVADQGTVSAGDQIGFVITTTNAGPGTTTATTVTDQLPIVSGVTWSIDAANSSSGCSISGGVLTCNFGTLAAGASRHVHLVGTTDKTSCQKIDNTANVTTGNDGSAQASDSVTVNCGDIKITKTADQGTVSAGDTIGFVITANNAGAGIARGVTVTDTLPVASGVTWTIDAANSSTGCSISSGALTCLWGDFASGASKHVHITSATTKDSCGTIDNTANVTTTNDGSGQASDSVLVNCGSLLLTKVADQDTVSAGDQIGFVITAKNTGAGNLTTVTVTDSLPANAGLSWSIDAANSDSGCSISAGTLTCAFGTLAPGASKHVHITSGTDKTTCGTVNNTANATTGNDGTGQASDSVVVNCGDIKITKTADQGTVSAGDQIGFVITATNDGAGIARGVSVSDPLPTTAGTSWSIDAANSSTGCTISAGALSCAWGDFASGASKHVHIVSGTDKTSCSTVDNTASVTTTNDGSGQASDSVIINCGDIGITKVADQGTVSAGDQIGFVVTATNSGAGIARGVSINDQLPTDSGTSWSIDAANSDSGCSISAGTLTCAWGDFASGASKHVHLTSGTDKTTCGVVSNTASVSTTNDGSGQDTATVTVNCGDIKITKTADQGTVSAGDTIGFVVTATNDGAGIARGVSVSDPLPTTPGTSWTIDAANSDSGCTISAGTLTCAWGDFASKATKHVHITSGTDKTSCSTVDNTASVTTTNDGSGQDSASVIVNCGDIHLTKTADQGSVSAGDQIGFVITATNSGAGEARTVTVTDSLPTTAGTSWSIDAANSDSGCTISAGTLTCAFGTLASGASKHVHITSGTDKTSCSTVDNTASVTTSNDGSAQDSASVIVNCGDIKITKVADQDTVSAGDTIGFVVTATNDGAGIARGVNVSDPLPTTPGTSWTIDAANSDSGCTISAGTLTCDWGDFASKASKHVHITSGTDKTSCSTVDNTASVTTTNDGSGQDSASVVVNCGDIKITKVADQDTVSAGDTIGFVITATNDGAGEARTVTVTDQLPTTPGTSWSIDAANSDSGCTISAGTLTCAFGTLTSGASKHVHITSGTDKTSCSTVDNTASVTTSNDGSGQASASVVVNCGNITLSKVADQTTASAGDTIGFLITAKNTGAGEARGVTVTDTLPTTPGTNWTIDAAGSDQGCSISGGVLTCNFGTLAAGASKHVHITSGTDKTSCSTVDNTASVTTTNDGSAEDSASVVVNCGDIGITKVADTHAAHAGDTIGFVITATNHGAGAARNVTVSDTLPVNAGTSWSVDAANSDAGCTISGGKLTCAFGTIAAGASKHVHITSPTTTATCGVVDNTATVTTSNDGGGTASDSTKVVCGTIHVVKDGPAFAYHGDTVHYTFTVTNSGNTPLSAVTVKDDHCTVGATPESRSNDDGDNLLENPGVNGTSSEVWVFGCDYKIPDHQTGEENPIHNTAIASGKDELGTTVTDTDDHNTQILHPAVNIEKTGPATATQGDRVAYQLTVTNPGDTPLIGQTLQVTDPQCDSPPVLVSKGRGSGADPTPDTLDPGDAWLYTCSVPTNSTIVSIDNVADVKGFDVNGKVVTDEATAHTDLGAVLPETVESGAAKLTGPASCVKKDFAFRITGRHIAKVVFRVDGKVVKTVKIKGSNGKKVTYKVNPSKFKAGLHKMTARITFNKANQTAPRTLRAVFEKCKKLVIKPQFTG